MAEGRRCPLRRGVPLLCLLALAALAGCDSLFFYPTRELVANPLLARVAREDVAVTSPDGVKLHGWFLRPREEARGAILFFHGNAENISTHVNSVLWLALSGYQVLLVDYRGYGKSEGTPDIAGIHSDALAAMEALLRIEGVRKDRIVVLGQSLGGSVAVHTVAVSPHRDKVKALVIDSAFAGYRRIAREKMADIILTWPVRVPASYLFSDRYSAERWISRIAPIPVLIIHGDADTVVPPGHASILYRLAGDPKELWIAPNAGHISAFADPEIRKRLLSWLSAVPDRSPAR